MTIYYRDDRVTLHHGDCIEVMASLPDASVDAVVTDPPYGLEFMGKDWDAPWKSAANSWADRDAEDHAQPENRGQTASPFLAAKVNKFAAGLPFQQWCELWAAECLRVLKPGGHLLAFGGTRTWHRLACAVEDAGFEIRDSLAWIHGQGFPKSLDVSKAIDKRANVNDETHRRIALVAEVIRTHREAKGMERSAVSLAVVGTPSGACWNWEHQQLPSAEMWPAIKRALDIPDKFDGLIEGTRAQFIGAEREVIGERTTGLGTGRGAVAYIGDSDNRDVTAPATPAAARWQGWGTALKPAFEPVVVARKPLIGTVAATVLAHGTGALNIDGCRIGTTETLGRAKGGWGDAAVSATNYGNFNSLGVTVEGGRWPANVVLDESQAEALDEQSGITTSTGGKIRSASRDSTQGASNGGTQGGYNLAGGAERLIRGDTGGASRFFYVAKADASERPRLPKRSLRLRDDLTPEQVDHVRARLVEAGVQVD